MSIFSAHYAYCSIRGMVKNPLIYVNAQGIIEKLDSCGDVYREVHSAQFFSGLLIPGFVLDFTAQFHEMPHNTNWYHLFISLFTKGVQYIVLPQSQASVFGPNIVNGPSFIYSNASNKTGTSNNVIESPWESMLKQQLNKSITLSHLLKTFLDDAWQPFITFNKGGQFTQGFSPGIWCINGIDYATNQLLPTANIKRIA